MSALFFVFPKVCTFNPAWDGENEYFQDLKVELVVVYAP